MKNTEVRKTLVAQLYLQKKTITEIIENLTEMGCVNASGQQWSRDAIEKDIKELTSGFTEKNLDELLRLKMHKFAELEELQRIATLKGDIKNALKALDQQVELLGLAAAQRIETTHNFTPDIKQSILERLHAIKS